MSTTDPSILSHLEVRPAGDPTKIHTSFFWVCGDLVKYHLLVTTPVAAPWDTAAPVWHS